MTIRAPGAGRERLTVKVGSSTAGALGVSAADGLAASSLITFWSSAA